MSRSTLLRYFEPGKLVSFLTSPLGLNLLIDHTRSHQNGQRRSRVSQQRDSAAGGANSAFLESALGIFTFAPGSTHFISGVTPQTGPMLESGGSLAIGAMESRPNALYQVPNNVAPPVVLTGQLSWQGRTVAFLTSPGGLQLNVDGKHLAFVRLRLGAGDHAHRCRRRRLKRAPTDGNTRSRTGPTEAARPQTYTVDQAAVNNGY